MSADLHIHVMSGALTQDDLTVFFGNVLGSKYFSWARMDFEKWSQVGSKISDGPGIWIGEVSWLKAALFEDGEDDYIPNPVGEIHGLIGEELPELDDALIENICGALTLENKTQYRIAQHQDVLKFLTEHKGEKVFTVSW